MTGTHPQQYNSQSSGLDMRAEVRRVAATSEQLGTRGACAFAGQYTRLLHIWAAGGTAAHRRPHRFNDSGWCCLGEVGRHFRIHVLDVLQERPPAAGSLDGGRNTGSAPLP